MIFEMRQLATGMTPNLGNHNRKIDQTTVWFSLVHRTELANTIDVCMCAKVGVMALWVLCWASSTWGNGQCCCMRQWSMLFGPWWVPCEAWWWEERVCVCIWLQVLFGYEFCLVMSSGKDRLRLVRLVFCWSLNFWNCERPKTRLQLRSLMVLRISSLGQSGSGSVLVFFQSWDWTSKH